MRKKISLFLSLVIVVLGISACSGKNTEDAGASELPRIGYYVDNCGSAIELFEDGTAILKGPGYDWLLTWDDENIYNNETGVSEKYTYEHEHLSFGWKGSDGFYHYEFDYSPDRTSKNSSLKDDDEPLYNDAPEDTGPSQPVPDDYEQSTDTTEPPNNSNTEYTDQSQMPYTGYYSNVVLSECAEDADLELFADGSAIVNIAGHVWNASWDDENLYNSETGEACQYTFYGNLIDFCWETEYGLRDYEVYYLEDAKLQRNFFDCEFSKEPYYIFHNEGTHYGFTEDFWEGCSVWCAVEDYRITATASSTLAPQGQFSYEASNIYNSDRRNAWIEGAEGYGIGEYIDITRSYKVADEEFGVDFGELCIVNGYAQTPEKWAANSRVKDLKVYFNGRYIDTIHLEDSIRPQYFDLTGYKLQAASGAESVFRFEIASVYPGDKYTDTAITGIEVSFTTPNH